ncbi:NAD(P)-binding protein [Anaerobacillus isosaccharinicus]|uniref:precorrin-2 dehydrogenase n=1 Tax=Anaerobacillus isosaccharinicus TaxID=1532552 RepID=A0A1S2LJ59_9BACI|nr:NAD(P)-binding protein [Anaerobacillus isosaccharinicus]MBA5586115.1 NAD(P)-binding protein [Anaerobacillus isosaccharinicus]QOY35617.1 NAD(P)-binding protein [Anaerobacillus isosaccharinicus]
MVRHYPISLNLKNKQVVIVGGGFIAERKLRKLLEAEADITVISPEINAGIQRFVTEGQVKWKKKCFSEEDLSKAFLIVAATNVQHVNRQVSEACNEQQLINIVDDPARSNFIVPSTLRRGKLVISVSTGGASPGLAKKIVAELSREYDDSYDAYLEFLTDCRTKIQEEITDLTVRKEVFQKLLDPAFLRLTKEGSLKEREVLFRQLL